MHKGLKRYILFFSAFCSIVVFVGCPLVEARNPLKDDQPKNVIHLDGATWIYVGMYSLNYERTVFSSGNIRMLSSAGVGNWYFTSISQWHYGISVPLSISNLIGKGNNHLEIDFGIRYTFFSDKSDKDLSPFLPVFKLGYRYQRKDGKGLVFRSFIGLSGAGIGIGKAF